MKRFLSLFLALAVLTFFALFLFLPLFTVVAEGCDPAVMREVFRSRLYLQGMMNSLALAVVTTAIVFLISIPLAALYDKYDFPGKAACSVLIMAPMILPPFVGALGFQQLLGHYGLLNSLLGAVGLPPVDWLGGNGRFWSVCVIQALHLYPIAYLNLVTAFGNIDPSLLESARNAGAGPWQRFRRITLPMLRPGLLAGGSIVLIWAFTELGTPLMFGYNTVTPVQIMAEPLEWYTAPPLPPAWLPVKLQSVRVRVVPST
jgi:iron(III) transport system permease protein